MGFLDAILGRTKPVKPNLDVLFAVPAASLTLQVDLDLAPTGVGAVCFSSAEGQERAEAEARALLGTEATTTRDEYGYTWITGRDDADLSAPRHRYAVNTTSPTRATVPVYCVRSSVAGTGEDRPARLGSSTCSSAARSTPSRRPAKSTGTQRWKCGSGARSPASFPSSPT
jgi:hypothetical protein